MRGVAADSLRSVAEPVYRPVIWFAKSFFATLGIRFDIVGNDHLPRVGGAVLAINHTSYLDFAFAGIPADRVGKRLVRFMAKDGVFRHPVSGPLMRGMRHIPVDRDAGSQAFRDAVANLKAGELVGVFPEATMSRSLEIKDIKNGAVRMAVSGGVPLIPMIVFGGHRILGYGVRDFSRGRTIAITIGEPMHPRRGEDFEEQTVQLRARMQQLLDITIDRYPVDPGDAGAWWLPARRGGSAPTMAEAEEIEARVRAEKQTRGSQTGQ